MFQGLSPLACSSWEFLLKQPSIYYVGIHRSSHGTSQHNQRTFRLIS